MWAQDWTLPEPTADTYSDDMMNNAKEFSDTAMVVITRVGGEGADLPTDVSQVTYTNNSDEYNDFEPGEHYLQLSQTERNMLDLVCENFDNVVVVYTAQTRWNWDSSMSMSRSKALCGARVPASPDLTRWDPS